MSDMRSTQTSKLHRLWALPLLGFGAWFLGRGAESGQLNFGLLGVGMLLGGVFALRHNLLDLSPAGLDPRQVGFGWVSLLLLAVLLVLAAAAVSIAT
ncbi:hypothetical protein [Arenimonas sp.]|uniref:hypothetical protein n=1 Tax=Arenimonas sp. TaxID=1872635 RepID=UPI0035B4FA57